MEILVVLALTLAIYPPALPWVGGAIVAWFAGRFLLALIERAHYEIWSWWKGY